jgi:biopolymer transport protein ExbB/TolQ
VALIGFLAGATTLALVATGLALVAALLNAVLGLCLGCEVYLLYRRWSGRSRRDLETPVPN